MTASRPARAVAGHVSIEVFVMKEVTVFLGPYNSLSLPTTLLCSIENG